MYLYLQKGNLYKSEQIDDPEEQKKSPGLPGLFISFFGNPSKSSSYPENLLSLPGVQSCYAFLGRPLSSHNVDRPTSRLNLLLSAFANTSHR